MTIAIDRRTRLVAEGVVAGYINDLSAATPPPVARRPANKRAGDRRERAAHVAVGARLSRSGAPGAE
jgi:hypothetical protein